MPGRYGSAASQLRQGNLQCEIESDDFDAEPGKILHEMRGGEMAALREVPFALYYGSVDSTPLFILLAGLYLERTDDIGTIATLWPSIEAALDWIDGPGDPDGDGRSKLGLHVWSHSEKGFVRAAEFERTAGGPSRDCLELESRVEVPPRRDRESGNPDPSECSTRAIDPAWLGPPSAA